ncbi:MAG: ribosome maturation factor RimM [Candidatus Acidiferrales bacterium]
MDSENSDYVTLARIVRPHGRRGEVAAEILTDFSERLTKVSAVELWDGKSARRRVAVRSCWLSRSRGGQAIFSFAGSNSISDAERLVGFEVQIPITERVVLPQGRYYITDLIGCEIWERGAARLGKVRDVQLTGEEVAGTPILFVDSPFGELLIPLAEEICVVIDVAAQRIEVVLPEGLRELNRE